MKVSQQIFIVPLLSFVFLSAISTACNNQSDSSTTANDSAAKESSALQQLIFDKLAGTWKSESGRSFERWTKKEDGTFRSVAFTVKGNDTSWNENADIYPENGQWVFENTVKGQNDGKAVKFVSTIFNDKSVQFTNPSHDFPTDINYTVSDANTVNAFIIGPDGKGGRDTIPFDYTRVE